MHQQESSQRVQTSTKAQPTKHLLYWTLHSLLGKGKGRDLYSIITPS